MRDSAVFYFSSLPFETQVILCSYLPIKTMRALSMTTKDLFDYDNLKKIEERFYFSALSMRVTSDPNYDPDLETRQLSHAVYEFHGLPGKNIDYGFVIRKNNQEYAKQRNFAFIWQIDICSYVQKEDDSLDFMIKSAEAAVHQNGRVEMFRCENDPADFSVDITNDFNRFLGFRCDFKFNLERQASLVQRIESDKNYRPSCTDDELFTEITEYNKGRSRSAMVDSFFIKPFSKDMNDFSKYFEIHYWSY